MPFSMTLKLIRFGSVFGFVKDFWPSLLLLIAPTVRLIMADTMAESHHHPKIVGKQTKREIRQEPSGVIYK